ncbi:ATP-binding protein [Streptomyces asiaticus]
MLGNLVADALHTPSGGTVSLRARAAGGEVLIEVADTGSGIAADELPHVFDRFWRDTVGEGSEFTIHLPHTRSTTILMRPDHRA